MKRVLGIDPGTRRTGWGVVESDGSRIVHIASGLAPGVGECLAERLATIADVLDEVVAVHAPQSMSVETLFHAKNAQSALKLGHARGVALLCAARGGLRVHEYTAGQIKQATTGKGRAEKEQVQQMVRLILGLHHDMALDTSDALAAAICHVQWAESPLAEVRR
ncbi:MAG: crossover junction endodeoxyribonuclease RuvC [Myxococcota bacterium]